jgi:hypothetical protein
MLCPKQLANRPHGAQSVEGVDASYDDRHLRGPANHIPLERSTTWPESSPITRGMDALHVFAIDVNRERSVFRVGPAEELNHRTGESPTHAVAVRERPTMAAGQIRSIVFPAGPLSVPGNTATPNGAMAEAVIGPPPATLNCTTS